MASQWCRTTPGSVPTRGLSPPGVCPHPGSVPGECTHAVDPGVVHQHVHRATIAPIIAIALRSGLPLFANALESRAADGRHTSDSAGSIADPGGNVHSPVIEVMNEIGIDLSDRRPQPLTDDLAQRADVVVTMGCGDSCPFIPGKRYIDWDLEDPKGQGVESVRATRIEIERHVESLLADLDAA